MKYLKFLLVIGIVFLTSSSYTTSTSRLSVGINPGNLIPDFTIYDESGKKLKVSDLKGQKVLINLWAAYDAKSHLNNVLFWSKLKEADSSIKMISVSFDQSESLFRKTLDVDGIASKWQAVDTLGKNSSIYKKYRLNEGFKSYLVDENGIILATDITPEDIDILTEKI
ncbi:MAG: TlpA family protein disulfide reductase [Dysgonomonas sp.]